MPTPRRAPPPARGATGATRRERRPVRRRPGAGADEARGSGVRAAAGGGATWAVRAVTGPNVKRITDQRERQVGRAMHHDLGLPRAARRHRDPHDVVAGRPIDGARGPGRGPVAAGEHELDRRALDGMDAFDVHDGDGDADDRISVPAGVPRAIGASSRASRPSLARAGDGARRKHQAGGDGGDGGGAWRAWRGACGGPPGRVNDGCTPLPPFGFPGRCHGTPGQTTMRSVVNSKPHRREPADDIELPDLAALRRAGARGRRRLRGGRLRRPGPGRGGRDRRDLPRLPAGAMQPGWHPARSGAVRGVPDRRPRGRNGQRAGLDLA